MASDTLWLRDGVSINNYTGPSSLINLSQSLVPDAPTICTGTKDC